MHDQINKSPSNEWTDGNALEEEYSGHCADDEGRNDFRGTFQQLDTVAARGSSQNAGNDSHDTQWGFKGVYHVLDCDITSCYWYQDCYSEQDDAPVDAIGSNGVQDTIETEYLENEYDSRSIGYRCVAAKDAEQKNYADCQITRIQENRHPYHRFMLRYHYNVIAHGFPVDNGYQSSLQG